MASTSQLDAAERERLEIAYWRDSPVEGPGAETLANLLNKMGEARIFLAYLEKLRPLLANRGTVLELGAGQGWSSCLYKKMFPEAHVVATDLSPYAIGSVDYWQRIFGATLERRYACKSYATAERDASVELVFCFAAAHHFADHAATIRELHRILRPGGRALYLHEPTCGRLLYPWAHERVNAARPEVPEDLLIVADQRRMAEQTGLALEVLASHRLLDATFFPTLNYRLQRLVPPLGKLLPSCGTFVFTKPG